MRSSVEFILGSREDAYTLIGSDDTNTIETSAELRNNS
jgi:hypothetical protein